jgi:hypothetical protein
VARVAGFPSSFIAVVALPPPASIPYEKKKNRPPSLPPSLPPSSHASPGARHPAFRALADSQTFINNYATPAAFLFTCVESYQHSLNSPIPTADRTPPRRPIPLSSLPPFRHRLPPALSSPLVVATTTSLPREPPSPTQSRRRKQRAPLAAPPSPEGGREGRREGGREGRGEG